MERFKVILSNNNIYHELALESDMRRVKIGTESDCVVRMDAARFFEGFSILLENEDERWRMTCGENQYLSADGVLRLAIKDLEHGDMLVLRNRSSNQEVIKISFTLDFEYERKDYSRVLDLTDLFDIEISGEEDAGIYLRDPLMAQDCLKMVREKGLWVLQDVNTRYGVYINGIRIKGKANLRDYDFFSVIGYSFYFKFDKLYTTSSNDLIVNNIDSKIMPESDGRFSYPVFNRNTRLKVALPTEEISILDPPTAPQKNTKDVLLNLLPTVGMVGVSIMLASSMGRGSDMVIRTAAMAGVTALVAIIGVINDRRTYKRDVKKRDTVYRGYIERKRDEIQTKRRLELAAMEEVYFSPAQELEMVRDFSSDLFDRVPEDEDFLHIRLGTGPLASKQQVSHKVQEQLEVEDELITLPETVANEFKQLPAAPIVVDGKSGCIGIVGNRKRLHNMLKNMLLDVSVRHYYDDIQLFLMTGEEYAESLHWARLLPHLSNEQLGLRNIICDEESKNVLFEYLYKLLSFRSENEVSRPHMVFFSYSDPGMKSHPISGYFERAAELGVTFLFFEEKKQQLPLGCGRVINLSSNESGGTLLSRESDTEAMVFNFEPIDDAGAAAFVQKLAPVYCEEVSLESNLTKNISLFQLLNILAADDIDLGGNWASSLVHKSMAAALGVNAKSDVVSLDLHEKYHGPHGLVAGTTGSGKSEILQSYILSMATRFHPYEVSFVIIDFKGGGMVNQFKDLPHLNGAITNIDGREINRSLLSIKAELKKRQALFSAANVNHIDAYIQQYKKGTVETPLPHLILVVDEFAELKMDQPEFMKELVSAARIGRSLGVHLILATQKPSGVVDDQIWSNSKFKLCLKVQNQADSNEVLKSPLAAEIREPGRAYLQVGNNEIFELFQSAYSGAPAVTNLDHKKKFKLYTSSMWGKRELIFEEKGSKSSEETDTQLDAIVRHVAQYAQKTGIRQLPGICLPPLGENIPYVPGAVERDDLSVIFPMGILDDPNRQLQEQVEVDLITGNMIIVGATQFGKTTMLQMLLRGLAETYSPKDLSFYLLDFASMALKMFDNLNHVGGVVSTSDDVKLKTFFKMMTKELGDRKDKLSKLGITSFASYREAGYRDIPFIVIALDNLTVFRELYEEYEDVLISLCREGVAYGICIVMTVASTRSLGYKYISNFPNRICLYCNQRDEYASMFERSRMEPKSVPGRALIAVDKEIYEYQNYLPFDGEKEIDRVNAVREFIARQNELSECRAKRIPEIPDILTADEVVESYGLPENYRIAAGMDFETVDAFVLDLPRLGYAAISGREKSGRTNILRYILHSLESNKDSYPAKAYIIDGYDRHLQALAKAPITERYTTDLGELEEILKEIDAACDERRGILMRDGISAIAKLPLLMVVIQHPMYFEVDGISKGCLPLVKKIIKASRELKTFILFTNLENAPIPYGAPDSLKMIKDRYNIIYFDNIKNCKLMDISLAETRKHKKELALGDAFFLTENSLSRFKTPLYKST